MRQFHTPSFLRGLRAYLLALSIPAFALPALADTDPLPTLRAGAQPIVLTIARGTAAPDGRSRPVMTINGLLPGPVIRAKENETIRVKVVNTMDVPTTMHWHGMHQVGTNRMDGVPGITSPIIAPGAEFVYEFKASPAGTHWYHSHEGQQESDGVFGALIIDEARPIAKATRDHVLLINDWFLLPGDEIMDNLRSGASMQGMDVAPKNRGSKKGDEEKGDEEKGGMGGMGGMDMRGKEAPTTDTPGMDMDRSKMAEDFGDVPFESGLINGKGRFDPASGPALETVEARRGDVIRLRLINASTTYALRFQVDGHPLTVIASDGMPLKPVEVDNLWLGCGERYDVLLKADGTGSQWIRAVTGSGEEIRGILRYADTSDAAPQMSPVAWGPRMLTVPQMRALQPEKFPTEGVKEMRLELGGSMRPYVWTINGEAYPKADSISLAADEEVRMIFVNKTAMAHPFHLHGHSFRVLGKPGALNLVDPPLKDTVQVPAGEELAIQWKASNPGKWFFHCHIAWHRDAGMTRVVDVAKP